ncbi:uncharacterized protein [Chironomus tepperi]|uniref:uncharacterized protein n=1 Tax=Chironomus tepperi TaxID=113505 RepID=UPI00391F56AE
MVLPQSDAQSVPVTPYYILRIDEIPTRISLYQLLLKLSPYSRHIIGIARTADYRAKRLGRTIFVYCTSLIDARFMEQTYIDLVCDGRDAQAPTIVDSVLGRATLLTSHGSDRYASIPVSVHIKGLIKQRGREGATNYLLQIITSFEDTATITGIRLNYDARKASTRSDGFVTYLNQREAREIGGETNPTKHLVFGREVSALLSENVPMLVRIPDSHIFNLGICEWSIDAERMNQLVIKHKSSTKPLRKKSSKLTNRDVINSQNVQDIQESTTSPIIVAQEQVPSTSVIAPQPTTSASSALNVNSQISATSTTKDVTRQKIRIVYDSSDDEIRLATPVKRKVINWSAKVASKKAPDSTSSSSSSSAEENSLLINEDILLEEDEETK